MAHTDHHSRPGMARVDRQYLRQLRKRYRNVDRQVLRATIDWEAYTHPRHPYPGPTYLPSW